MGFDVVYLPPIHPIGTTFRKGPNNTLSAGPDDVGVPWAIGSPEGGHDAVHPDLGTIEDFDHFVARARELDLEIALDFALQCSPDHPWVQKHPEWFHHRPDGTIAYAENPPKKYQDIYPIAFDADLDGLVTETLRVLRHWMGHGVRIFRVDNPHTKPVVFWERVIGEINRTDPDVIFLAEAFTRPAMMHTLGPDRLPAVVHLLHLAQQQAGTDRVPHRAVGGGGLLHAAQLLRQHPRHPARVTSSTAAAPPSSCAPSWPPPSPPPGASTAATNCARTPRCARAARSTSTPRSTSSAPATGPRPHARAAPSPPSSPSLNAIRRRATPRCTGCGTSASTTPTTTRCIAYSKRTGPDTVLVVVNLDPHHTQEATVSLDMPQLGLDWDDSLSVHDELTGETYRWGRTNYVRLEPGRAPAHVLHVQASPPQIGGPSAS